MYICFGSIDRQAIKLERLIDHRGCDKFLEVTLTAAIQI